MLNALSFSGFSYDVTTLDTLLEDPADRRVFIFVNCYQVNGKKREALLKKIGLKISTRFLGRATLRAIPILGAIGNGAYSYYDTYEVGKTAAAYFKALADQGDQDGGDNTIADTEKNEESETIN